ncbi:MAG: hypothetical protein HY698_13805 [Deltaproteobacteria bacterium]|nr:hypothetical protein [Deltaproteobacteria bacterium]
MKFVRNLACWGALCVTWACGPGERPGQGNGDAAVPDAGRPDASIGPTGIVSGTVWAPGNAPGLAPAGHEIPVFAAMAYLSLAAPAPIPQEVYCDRCVDPVGHYTFSDPKGNFQLKNIKPGTYWLVIQKGQFRLDQQVVVEGNQTLALPTRNTTLPSQHDPANGKWVPRIALAEGNYDQLEDILGKMGMGTVDDEGALVASSIPENLHMYKNVGSILGEGYGTGKFGAAHRGTLNDLVADLSKMSQYHIIFVPCSAGPNTELFSKPAYRENIRKYVQAGGKFYVTDWSAEWEDVVFPEFIRFVADHDTPPGAGQSQFNKGDGGGVESTPDYPRAYNSFNAKAEHEELNEWLNNQVGPLVTISDLGTIDYSKTGVMDANNFAVEGNWNRIEETPSVVIGTNEENMPVRSQGQHWVVGDWSKGDSVRHPLTVTFEPGGCGRVLFSTYHTTEDAHAGLVPQERVLLYLIMEIGVCKSGPIIE